MWSKYLRPLLTPAQRREVGVEHKRVQRPCNDEVHRVLQELLEIRESDPEIETLRLLLLPMSPDHAEALHRIWNERRNRTYLWDNKPVLREQVDKVINASMESFSTRGFGLWTLIEKQTGGICGFCGYRPLAGTREIELLYGIATPLWGRGLATEAALAALAQRPAERIVALANPANRASWRVLEKIGMKFEKGTRANQENLLLYALSGE